MEAPSPKKIIWQLSTRILHWCVAVPTLANYLLEGGEKPHEWAGYAAALFVGLRLLRGLVCRDHAHFRHFPLHPRSVVEHLLHITERHRPTVGHNPLASWVYLFMWSTLIALAVTGFMMGMDAYWGEEWLENLHEDIATGLQVLIALHFLGLAYDSWRFKRKTWLAMFTGR